MSPDKYVYRSLMPAPAGDVFTWHKRPGAFDRLTPPWANLEVLERTGGIEDGARVVLLVHNGPISIRWTLEHKDYEEGRQFCDFQVDGPFSIWEQVHRVEPDGPAQSYLEDSVDYELPAGFAGEMAAGFVLHHELERLFKYRHETLANDLAVIGQAAAPLKILISGSTGLIGSQLVPFLTTQGHEVKRLVRRTSRLKRAADPAVGKLFWEPDEGEIDLDAMEGFDAIVHLAGENIVSGRWTEEKKERIRKSRLRSTRLISQAIGQLKRPPGVFASASAIGYYGDRSYEAMGEESPQGSGFLADVCQEWEAESMRIASATRVVNLRFGVVLSPRGGALHKMLPAFSMGAGGPVGDGQQHFSWIDIDDAVLAIYQSILNDQLKGPLNVVAPNTVTNAQFAHVLGRVLHRPSLIPLPAFAARAMFGELADECLLSSTKVLPLKLQKTGFKFRYPDIEQSLRHVLGRAE